jgi:hypothetical protein
MKIHRLCSREPLFSQHLGSIWNHAREVLRHFRRWIRPPSDPTSLNVVWILHNGDQIARKRRLLQIDTRQEDRPCFDSKALV